MNRKLYLFNEFLTDKNITTDEILSQINTNTLNPAVMCYCSKLDGLGNQFSDIDVYVFDKSFVDITFTRSYQNCSGVEVIEHLGTPLDIEYWRLDEIHKIIDKLKNITKGMEVDEDILKLLLRMSSGIYLRNNEEMNDVKNSLESLNLNDIIIDKFDLESKSYYEDALNLFKAKDYLSSLDCARRSLQYAIAVINTKNGMVNLKYKWFSKIFVNQQGFGDLENLNEFKRLQYFSNINEENISDHVEEMLFFTQSLFNKFVF